MSAKYVTFEKKGFRDVHWCPFLNEPTIVHFPLGEGQTEREATCAICQNTFANVEHPFICHILKPLDDL